MRNHWVISIVLAAYLLVLVGQTGCAPEPNAVSQRPQAITADAAPNDPAAMFTPFASPLSTLPLPHPGRALHEGSWDRKGGNHDYIKVPPGQTITLLDYQGAGVIRRFWMTIAPRAEVHLHRQVILRMYWDDQTEPAVECPIGDFFGVGFGQQRDFISLPLNETSGGYNCYWPMPFHKHARWTLENRAGRAIDAFYYNIDFTAYDSIPPDIMLFNASWRRENPTTPGKNYCILETEGEGIFAGVALFMQAIKPQGLGFLEGDEMIYIDQKQNAGKRPNPAPIPQINGTGTEDYFSSGWYFDRGTYSAPFHGCVIKDEGASRISAYRWHIEDAMPFHHDIRVTIEHGTNNDHQADYSSVAYFYQSGQHFPYPPLPTNADDLLAGPIHFPNVIEAESLISTATATGGNFKSQAMGGFAGSWSDDSQLFWEHTKVNDELKLQISAPKDGEYQLGVYVTTAPDYAIIQVMQDGKPVGGPIDLYSPTVASHPLKSLGKVALKKRDNPITIRIVGQNEKSTGTLVGIDAFSIK